MEDQSPNTKKAIPQKPQKCQEYKMLSEIAADLRENKDRSAIIKPLFTIVPDLETIQKDIRQKVCNQITFRQYKTSEIIAKEDEDLKEFFVILEGACQFIAAGQPFDAKVFFSFIFYV